MQRPQAAAPVENDASSSTDYVSRVLELREEIKRSCGFQLYYTPAGDREMTNMIETQFRTLKKQAGLKGAVQNIHYTRLVQALQDEKASERPDPNYFTLEAGESSRPPRPFCSVCGYWGLYKCPQKKCNARVCSIECRKVHIQAQKCGANIVVS
ncbi:zinc finger HIT domain-containing protein 1 [Carpediemonas membranifera]|uniref:Zinc finger HIT domain-containing protein 1 n=1 Tax=Carpediemonas membranifera TaxID=201153 RepID=A0A8J6E1K0_9EUKA|nr:zinc finger HIT domain-containing protein 1 [Carpediemonas membranifera]|eukprot:KAG9393161.1 zinc finger HIT domain-containing protein 1 [Carpediemonas membranifera]